MGKLEDCDPAEAEAYNLKAGDNVIADIAVPCGECLLCKSGDDAIGVESVYAITVGNNGKREELAVQLGAKEVFNLTKMGTQVITDRMQKENGGLGVDLCVEA